MSHDASVDPAGLAPSIDNATFTTSDTIPGEIQYCATSGQNVNILASEDESVHVSSQANSLAGETSNQPIFGGKTSRIRTNALSQTDDDGTCKPDLTKASPVLLGSIATVPVAIDLGNVSAAAGSIKSAQAVLTDNVNGPPLENAGNQAIFSPTVNNINSNPITLHSRNIHPTASSSQGLQTLPYPSLSTFQRPTSTQCDAQHPHPTSSVPARDTSVASQLPKSPDTELPIPADTRAVAPSSPRNNFNRTSISQSVTSPSQIVQQPQQHFPQATQLNGQSGMQAARHSYNSNQNGYAPLSSAILWPAQYGPPPQVNISLGHPMSFGHLPYTAGSYGSVQPKAHGIPAVQGPQNYTWTNSDNNSLPSQTRMFYKRPQEDVGVVHNLASSSTSADEKYGCLWRDNCGISLEGGAAFIKRHIRECHFDDIETFTTSMDDMKRSCDIKHVICRWSGCNTGFMKLDSIGRHIATSHLRAREVVCSVCKLPLSRGDALTRHKRERPSCADAVRWRWRASPIKPTPP